LNAKKDEIGGAEILDDTERGGGGNKKRGQADGRCGGVNQSADADAEGGDVAGVAALADAATDNVKDGGTGDGEEDEGRADKEKELRMVGKHGVWMAAPEVRLRCHGGQEDRFAARDDDSVLVMRGEAAVGCADGPAVAVERDAARTSGDDGLDSDDETFGEQVARERVGEIGDAGLFVNGTADTVATEFADDVEAAAPDFALDGAADVLRAVPGAGSGKRLAESALGAVREFTGFFLHGRNLDGDGGVGVIAVFDRGEIELDEIAGLNDAIARDAVNDFVVDTDADVAGEFVDERRRGLRAVFGQDARANCGKFGGGDARANGV